jgi:regulator of cell morphogenesis and NO signaling
MVQIAEANRAGNPIPAPPFGSIANPINMMEHEHANAGDAIEKIKTLSNNYSPPDYACNTYRVLYAKLKEFEEDLNKHIHLENNILFPRAIKMENLTFS